MKALSLLAAAAAMSSLFLIAGCQADSKTAAADPAATSTSTPADTDKATGQPMAMKDSDAKTPEPAKAGALPKEPKDGDEVAVLDTDKGQIVIMFYPEKAPKHVENFIMLAKKGFYDGTRFHRCIPNFMIQGGDPNSKDISKAETWGTGGYMENGTEHTLKAEFNDIHHEKGVLSMARSQSPDSASSQFFICQGDDAASLDGQYSAFGMAIKGLDVIDEIVKTGGPDNGKVEPPSQAVVLKSVKIEKWPLK